MGPLDRLFHRLGLVTLPPAQATTVTWDFVNEKDVIMPRRCAGDPAHEGVAVEKKILGKRSKSASGESSPGSGVGCALLSLVILLASGWLFFRTPGRQTVNLAFSAKSPYCPACSRGQRRTGAAIGLSIALAICSCIGFFYLAIYAPKTMAWAALIPLATMLVFFVVMLLLFSARGRADAAVRIVDFSVLPGVVTVDLRFHHPGYAALFLLENSIWALNNDTRPGARLAAARRLGEMNEPQATLPLVTALGDADDGVRQAAVGALVSLKDPEAQGALIASLQVADVRARLAAVTVLKQQMAGERAAEAMIRLLRADESPQVRLGAAEALALGGEAAVAPLVAALQDADAQVRAQAANSLRALSAFRAVPQLIAALADPVDEVRQAAAGALGVLRDPSAIDPLIRALRDSSLGVRQVASRSLLALAPDQPLVQALHALIHGQTDERARAAERLGEIGDARAIPSLQRALRDAAPVAQGAARALVRFGGDQALEVLLDALKDSGAGVRAVAAEALGQLADRRAEDALVQTLRDPAEEVRRSAAAALVIVSSASFRPVAEAIRLLVLGQVAERQAAVRSLTELGDQRVMAVLTQALLNDEDTSVRVEVARVMPRLGGTPIDLLVQSLDTVHADKAVDVLIALGALSVEPLVRVVGHAQGESLQRAVRALAGIENDRAVQALLEMVKRPEVDAMVRLTVARALGKHTQSPGVIPGLILLLRDANRLVREEVCKVLGQSGSPLAVEPLIQALGEPAFRNHARDALVQLGDVATAALLERYQSEKDRDVRRAIGELLGDKKPGGLRLFGRKES